MTIEENVKAEDTKLPEVSPAIVNEVMPEPVVAPALSDEELEEAKKEGIKDAVREDAKLKHQQGFTDPQPVEPRIIPTANVFQLQYLVDLPADELAEKMEGTDKEPGLALSEGQVAGLLEVERSGKNRTDIVKVLCARLGIKSPIEVTAAGPAYTNDTTSVKL